MNICSPHLLYDRAAALDYEMDAKCQDWFNPDIPASVSFPWTREDIIASEEIAADMIDAGDTYWNHPGWIADIHRLLDEWMHDGNLIRVRLTAEWLLTTLPGDPIDPELAPKLRLLAAGEFSQVWQGAACPFPALPEQYLKSLKWGLVSLACDRVFAMGISQSGFTHMRKDDRYE